MSLACDQGIGAPGTQFRMPGLRFGIALGIYTGILLSAMVARPLWNSAILGPLFLFSGLSAAAMTSATPLWASAMCAGPTTVPTG